MGIESQLGNVSPMLRRLFFEHKDEIDGNRLVGAEMRSHARQYPHRNGGFFTRPIHPIEMAIVKELVPEMKTARGKDLTKVWYWVLNQDWGRDFRSCPFDDRYKHVESTNAKG